jgi:hypothetical protein
MTDIQIFAFVILPLSLAAIGAAISYLYVRAGDKDEQTHPGE